MNFQRKLPTLVVTILAFSLVSVEIFAEAPTPAKDFFRNRGFDEAVMSPAGKHIAATVTGGPRARRGLVVFDAYNLANSKAIVLYADADVVDVEWINDDRLIFGLLDLKATGADQARRGMFAVDREGKTPPRDMHRRWLRSVLHDGSNDLVFQANIGDGSRLNSSTKLLRIDTTNGRESTITRGGPDGVHHWALDAHGNPRAAISLIDGKSRLLWRVTAAAPWTVARAWNTFTNIHESPAPLAVDGNNRLYLVARDEKDADMTALYRVDMNAKDATWEPLMTLAGYDFSGNLIFGKEGKLLGVNNLTDAYGTTWLDPTLKAIQAEVDKALPGTINQISCGSCANIEKILIHSWSDRQPIVTRLFDTRTRTIAVLGNSRPWIKAEKMATLELHRFTARDGLSIPVHVTKPKGQKGAAPMVVLVHGGPWERGGAWGWNAQSQFLASRGYVVVEPEFRGSTGFGFKHFRAGWKQWGLAIQDDIADATRWAIKQGYADERRVCIAGGSFGGYAALMGLVRDSELYRCAISWAGVSDIDLIYTARWSDLGKLYEEYGMPVLVGDRDKDAAQLAATSPLKQVARITKPVLMAHGDEDARVPIIHGHNMKRALEKQNTPVEWISYKDEGHSWLLESNTVDFWTRVENFLQKNTSPP